MNSVITNKTYQIFDFNQKEILRYAACKQAEGELARLLDSCIDEVRDKLSYRVCYRILPLSVEGDCCDFGLFKLNSQGLARNLSGCEAAVVFAATLGVGIDRLIAKYGRISPVKALLFQAIGAEQIEALCDNFCEDIEAQLGKALRPRFSPGYGDLPLEAQRNIFEVLDCEKRIGATLNESLLMSPSKSVTAFIGIADCKKSKSSAACVDCSQKDCIFRKDSI